MISTLEKNINSGFKIYLNYWKCKNFEKQNG